MQNGWKGKMRWPLYVLLLVACAGADESEDRRSKLPYVADAVGNTLPPPSNLPATVGSPVNLLTPDRYEFYTFDESGELVKRLMTLEEIQAIVAAGEEAEGLVTFANDNQPTIAFNFSQPPYTKVHSVVTNVQNVLKAQMEAHKNKPLTQPTLDTPDVSDSWSLILPSIFGNTGVDIVPDKTSGGFTTPETETIELDQPVKDILLSKEGSNQITGTSSTVTNELKDISDNQKVSTTEKVTTKPITTTLKTTTTTTTTTTTRKPTTSTTTTTPKPTQRTTTTTIKPATTFKSTTAKPSTTVRISTTASKATTTTKPPIKLSTTAKPLNTTTNQPRTPTTSQNRFTTTAQPRTTTTAKPRTTTTSKATTKVNIRTTSKPTTARPITTTNKQAFTTQKGSDGNFTRINVQTLPNTIHTTEKSTIHYEKISTFVPISTATFITERTTKTTTVKPVSAQTSRPTVPSTTRRTQPSTFRPPTSTFRPLPSSTPVKISSTVTTRRPSLSTAAYVSTTANIDEFEKINATTITTQSVSPSTTVSTTEFVSLKHPETTTASENNNLPDLPLFDVAQSISQIASDLGNNYKPIPTTSELLDTTQFTEMNLESKENVEIDIPNDSENGTIVKSSSTTEKNTDNFVKISTLLPHKDEQKLTDVKEKLKTETSVTTSTTEKAISTTTVPTTTIDPVLSESMDELMSQIVNQMPQNIMEAQEDTEKEDKLSTTEKERETTPKPMKAPENITEKIEITTKSPQKVEESNMKINTQKTNNVTSNILDNNIPAINSIKQDEQITKDHENLKVEPDKNENEKPQNYVTLSPNTIKSNENHQTTATTPKVEKTTERLKDKISEIKPTKAEILKEDIKKPLHDISNKNKETKPSTTTTTSKTTTMITTKATSTTTQPPKVVSEPPVAVNKSETPLAQENIKINSSSSESPTVVNKTEITSTQSVNNKISSSANNRITSHDEKDKNVASDPFPKIDDFKKKFQKVNIDDKEIANERNNSWKLISTVSPPKANEIPKDKLKNDSQDNVNDKDIVLEFSKENQGLEVTTKDLGEDIAQFTELCNELAFRYWHTLIETIDKKRSFVLSPYSITSMLAMMFMGARGATSGEMNEILKLDDMVTFNPHFTLKNISDSIETNPDSGIVVSAFIRELFSDRSKGKILTFYKERAQHFYNGHVEEINFKLISDIIRRRTNLLVKRYTWGRIVEYMKANSISMQPPLAAFSANIFQTDCSGSSVEGRDGEMYFVVSPNVRQRRLVPVPAVVYRTGFLAGYDPVLDATAAALGSTNSIVSTLFVMPGQQGNIVNAADLEALEKRLLDSNPTTPAWNRVLRTLLPRIGLELQIPRFSHKSIFNISSTLRQMGLKDLFDAEHADLAGLSGPSKELYLSDMIQQTTFVTCGEGVIGEQHHIEEYPETLGGRQKRRTSRWFNDWDEPRDYQRAFHDPHDVGEAMRLPLHLRPRQARLPARNAQPARLKFDRPFLYFVRHNPTGMILYVGRYNPRLLP